jgi:hypothetical protein
MPALGGFYTALRCSLFLSPICAAARSGSVSLWSLIAALLMLVSLEKAGGLCRKYGAEGFQDFAPQTWQESLVRESLCAFGDSDVVQSAFSRISFTGGWDRAGNLSLCNRKECPGTSVG